MVKVDMITGFMGCGKTTFLKEYVRFRLGRNIIIVIVEELVSKK